MKKIKNIFVPTDFSDTSRNAYHYAKKLAMSLNATVTVLHINEYFMTSPEMAIGSLSEYEVIKMSEEAMLTFVANEDSADHWKMTKHPVKTQIIKGSLVSTLVEMSKSEDTDLIVMGMTGAQDFLGKIIGTASLDVSNKAHCPVVLVPRDAKWQRLEKIMYASNYTSATPKMMNHITDFARVVRADIHFIHVADLSSGINDGITKKIWAELFSMTDTPDLSFEVHTVSGIDEIEPLKKYAENNGIQLMAFVSKHRNFWERIIFESVSKNMALVTDIPIMVMHSDD
jgi:nucleotide-binding universal stress UspA family protein